MDVSETLRRAWVAVQEAGLPDDVQLVAFREAIRLLAPVSVATATVPPAPMGSGGGGVVVDSDGGGSSGDSGISEGEIYDRVVAQTGIDRDQLEQIVHVDGDALQVSIPGLRLGRNNAERARAVAQILTITRGFGLGEMETPLAVIRAECDRLRVYDQNNFSAHMKALTGYVVIGSGNNRRLRAKSPGIAAFPTLLDNLLGSGG